MRQLTHKAQLSQHKQAATKTYIHTPGLPPPGVWQWCTRFNFACLHASSSALISSSAHCIQSAGYH